MRTLKGRKKVTVQDAIHDGDELNDDALDAVAGGWPSTWAPTTTSRPKPKPIKLVPR